MTQTEPAPVIDRSDEQWHVDRKVPIALIVTLFMQTGGFVWFGAKVDARVEALEKQYSVAAPTATEQGTRLTRVETKLEAVQDGISEIKSILRKEPPLPKNR